MIKDHCFSPEWMQGFKNQKAHRKIDTIILEKMIYALHLLERLAANGLDFVFKGGTCLILLLEDANRFSIDIDIICKEEREKLEAVLDEVIASSKFTDWKLETQRSYKPGVPKAHYKLSFPAQRHGSGTILLDILQEDIIYPKLVKKAIQTRWIECSQKTNISLPDIDSITGDKLTAFAPNTIGIPYFKGENSFSMEICKQLFDLGQLFDRVTNMEIVAKSFYAFAKKEIGYRKQLDPDRELTAEKVLHDSLKTSVIIAKRGKGSPEEKEKFSSLQKGIRAFGTGYLMSGNFRIEEAIAAGAKVALLCAKILKKDFSPLIKYQKQDVKSLNISEPDWNFLNRLKKLPDKSSFFYWNQVVQVLGTEA